MSDGRLMTVVEMPEFTSTARKLLDDTDRELLIEFLASHPQAGDLMQGTGGVRKLRWALQGRGKSGGARVIYFYHDMALPLFLFTIYAKNSQSDLSDAARNELKKITKAIVEGYKTYE